MSGEEISSLELPRFHDYLKLARIDHWFKNIFMVPGMIFAMLYTSVYPDPNLLLRILVGVLVSCLIASANYIINEWLDAEFDKYHPEKKNRPSVTKQLDKRLIYLLYGICLITGLVLAWWMSLYFFLIALLFAIMGIVYNVRPFRTKERTYIDVISESVNNPIRFSLGWLIFIPTVFPPSSILVAYWMGGAFLMACKRYAEYRFINNPKIAGLYRKSFYGYSADSLLISIFFYALTSTFFLGIFLIKHRVELLITFPFIALMFSWYLRITLRTDSTAQKPEKLYRNWKFMIYCILLSLLFLLLLFIDIEPLNFFLRNNIG